MTKVYDAEKATWPKRGRYRKWFRPADGMTLAEQRAIALKVAEHFDLGPVTVKRGRSPWKGWARYSDRTISLGTYCGPAYVCHEVAHLAAAHRHGENVQAHGPEFRALYVEAVRVGVNETQARRLAASLAKFYPADNLAIHALGG